MTIMQGSYHDAGVPAPPGIMSPGIMPAGNNQTAPAPVNRPMGSIELGGGALLAHNLEANYEGVESMRDNHPRDHVILSYEECKESWEPIKMTIDSGASDSVIPRGLMPHIPIDESLGSKMGVTYTAAN